MKDNLYILPSAKKPYWLTYPIEFINHVDNGNVHMIPWHFYTAERSLEYSKQLLARFGRELIPFAYRQDNDDRACFEKECGETIKIIHDFSARGSEDEGSYKNFHEWMISVENEMREWEETEMIGEMRSKMETMKDNMYIISVRDMPYWLIYPMEFLELMENENVAMPPWHFYTAEESLKYYRRLSAKYGRELIPFAYKQDSDNIACFEKEYGKTLNGEDVKIIHDSSSKGLEDKVSYKNFHEWLLSV